MVKKYLKNKFVIGGAVIIAAVGGYFTYHKINAREAEVQYVTAPVEKGTLVASVEGTGQVVAENQIDVTPEVSGRVLSVNVKAGQEVAAGAIIAHLDSGDASKSVRDAQANLESAKIALQKLQQPESSSALMSANNAVTSAQQAATQAREDLSQAHEDGYDQVAEALLAMPTILTSVNDMFDQSYLSNNTAPIVNSSARDYRNDAKRALASADDAVKDVTDKYKTLTRQSDGAEIKTLIDQAYEAAILTGDAVKAMNTFVDYVERKSDDENPPQALIADQSALDSYTTDANGQISSLASARQAVMNAKSDIESADRNVEEKAVSLQESRNGADALDIKSAQLTVTQRQNALRDAYEELAEYTVCAPIAGVIASVAVQTGGTAGSGSAVATLVTKQKIAEVALNEIDITSVKTGQKVNLTFDAVDGLTITGSVAEVDQLGTSSQGVVSYTVKIGFDTDDERIKANMSVTAAIITEARQDVLLAPNSAVKTQGEAKYVQTLNGAGDPENKSVEVGLSNDTMTEIISGLNVGDEIITQTINPANTSSTSQSGTGLPGFSNGGGNRNFGSGAGQTIKIPGGGG